MKLSALEELGRPLIPDTDPETLCEVRCRYGSCLDWVEFEWISESRRGGSSPCWYEFDGTRDAGVLVSSISALEACGMVDGSSILTGDNGEFCMTAVFPSPSSGTPGSGLRAI